MPFLCKVSFAFSKNGREISTETNLESGFMAAMVLVWALTPQPASKIKKPSSHFESQCRISAMEFA